MADKGRIRIKLKAFDYRVLDKTARDIVETVKKIGGKVAGPVPLPTEIHRYCVLRSPHVNKDSREHFEVRTHKRLLDILNPTQDIVTEFQKLDLASGVKVEMKS